LSSVICLLLAVSGSDSTLSGQSLDLFLAAASDVAMPGSDADDCNDVPGTPGPNSPAVDSELLSSVWSSHGVRFSCP